MVTISLELLAALVMLGGLTLYGLLGGADFGGGVWILFRPRARMREYQDLISQAIGPVWEANHVWLIFVMVVLFSAFPPAFATISIAFFVPFHFVLLGIILRGSAFVFRNYGPRESGAETLWTAVFGAASIITPYLLGLALAALSMGGIRLVDGDVVVNTARWFHPFGQVAGLLTLALSAYLAAVYLVIEADGDQPGLRKDFHARAIGSGIASLALGALILTLAPSVVPHMWERLTAGWHVALPLLWGLTAFGSLWFLWRDNDYMGRNLAAASGALALWSWGVAQWPYIIYPDVTFAAAAAPDHVLGIILGVLPFGALILIPSLWYLFRVFKHRAFVAPRPGTDKA